MKAFVIEGDSGRLGLQIVAEDSKDRLLLKVLAYQVSGGPKLGDSGIGGLLVQGWGSGGTFPPDEPQGLRHIVLQQISAPVAEEADK